MARRLEVRRDSEKVMGDKEKVTREKEGACGKGGSCGTGRGLGKEQGEVMGPQEGAVGETGRDLYKEMEGLTGSGYI